MRNVGATRNLYPLRLMYFFSPLNTLWFIIRGRLWPSLGTELEKFIYV